MSIEDLVKYLEKNPPTGVFKPKPFFNKAGRQIEWYWSDELCYAEPVMVDGVWVGSIFRSQETKLPVGVEIFIRQEWLEPTSSC